VKKTEDYYMMMEEIRKVNKRIDRLHKKVDKLIEDEQKKQFMLNVYNHGDELLEATEQVKQDLCS